MNTLPIFKAMICNEEDKMLTISFVDYPATESDFVAFEKEKELVRFSVESEEKRLVRGLVMAANQLIYRYSPNFGEYYIVYEPDTIRLMAEKYLKDGFQNNVDLMHDGKLVDGVNMVQFFIKDSANGIDPKPFEDYADGSLFAEFHVENDSVWEQVKNGDFKGFSLEGFFSIEQMQFNKQDNNNNKENRLMSKVSRLKEMLKQMLEIFGEVSTDGGTIIWDTDEELKIGDAVHGIDEDGNDKPLEDGTYVTEDNKQIVVKDGIVEDIIDDEAEVASDEPAEETGEEMDDENPASEDVEPAGDEPEADEKDALIDELKARIAELEAENTELKEKVAELEKEPAAPSAEEAFKKADENKPMTKADEMRKRGYRW